MDTEHDPNADVDLPRGMALAWGVAAHPQRGPKRELSIERIVDAAIEIADATGLASVSMSAVAAALDFTTMSLYRYVTSKDELIMLMQEGGMGVPPHTPDDIDEWRDAVQLWNRNSRALYAAHPWLLDIPISGTPMTPNNLAWLDEGLAALSNTPLSPPEKLSAMLLVTGHSRWQAAIERGYVDQMELSGLTPAEFAAHEARLMRVLVTDTNYPLVYETVVAGYFDSELTEPFTFGLERILDGIQSYIDAREAGEPAADLVPEPAAVPDESAYAKDPRVREAAKKRREAEAALREARKREKEAVARARERAAKDEEKAAREREKAARAGS